MNELKRLQIKEYASACLLQADVANFNFLLDNFARFVLG